MFLFKLVKNIPDGVPDFAVQIFVVHADPMHGADHESVSLLRKVFTPISAIV